MSHCNTLPHLLCWRLWCLDYLAPVYPLPLPLPLTPPLPVVICICVCSEFLCVLACGCARMCACACLDHLAPTYPLPLPLPLKQPLHVTRICTCVYVCMCVCVYVYQNYAFQLLVVFPTICQSHLVVLSQCNTPQHNSTHRNTLQYTATLNYLLYFVPPSKAMVYFSHPYSSAFSRRRLSKWSSQRKSEPEMYHSRFLFDRFIKKNLDNISFPIPTCILTSISSLMRYY